MTARLRQAATGTAALALLTGLAVGIPTALIRTVGWPLPTVWPSLDQLTATTRTGIADTTIIKLLAVIVWAAWAQLAGALTVEATAYLRRRTATILPLLPGIQPLAARLIAAVALLAATTSNPRAAAATPLHTVVAAAPSSPALAPADHTPPPAPPATSTTVDVRQRTVTVAARDSWWRLAERHLDDGMRWREIRDANLGATMPDGTTIGPDTDTLTPGWRLAVPAPTTSRPARHPDQRPPAATTVADPAPSPAPPAGPPAPPAGTRARPDTRRWQVAPGDNFWTIAQRLLDDAWDRPPDDDEIRPYWHTLIDTNRHQLADPDDPDLLYPDQQLTIPATPPDPTATADHTTAPTPPATTRHDPAGPAPTAPPSEAGPSTVGHDGWRTTITNRHADPAPTGPQRHAGENDGEPVTGLGVPVGLGAGLAAAGLVAAGVLATIRWRRRRALHQRGAGLRLPTPLPDTDDHLADLDTAALPGRVCDDLASLLATIPPDVHPALVTLHDDGHVQLLFDDRAVLPDPPAPWTLAHDGTNGPVGWQTTLGVAGPERSIGLPLLATLGRTGTTTLLADLAALPILTLDGPDKPVRRRLRALALEIATSRLAIPVEVTIAGDRQLTCLDRIRHVDDLTGELDAASREHDLQIVADDRTPRLLVAHPDATLPDIPTALDGHVGAIAAGPPDRGTWQLHLVDQDTGRLTLPDGGQITLALPAVDPDLIDHELARLDHGATQPADPHPAADHHDKPSEPATQDRAVADPQRPPPADTRTAESDHAAAGAHSARVNGNGHRPAPTPTGRPDPEPTDTGTGPAFCEVQLLGPTEVRCDGAPVDGLTPRTTEVLAYLVTHRDGVSKERLDDAVWAGRAARPGSQRVTAALTRLRATLGDGPDGQPLVPRRTGNQRIRLSDHVGSDLDRAFAHLAIARDLPAELAIAELTAALDLVRGEPFEDLPVTWAADITQRAIIQLQDAAVEVARTHRRAGNYDAAETAIRQGLQLLDPADALYLERAELERDRGHPERIPHIWRQLRRRHAADADEIAGYVSTPAPETELAFQNLMAGV